MNIKITLNISKFYEACLKSWNTEYKLTQKKMYLIKLCTLSHKNYAVFFQLLFKMYMSRSTKKYM